MRHLCAVVFAALFLTGMVVPTLAQDVTLTSRDGEISVSGTLLSFDGEFYRIKSVYGALTLDGTGVTCAGVGCPNLETYVAEFSISGAQPMGEILLPTLVEHFAEQSGMLVRREIQDDAHYAYVLRLRDSGRRVVRITFRVSNTDEGFAEMLAGETDMVMAMREITASEVQAARDAGLGDMKRAARSRIVGLDGLVPVVAQSNQINAIALSDLAQIYSGEISNWQEIGGPDAPIYLHLQEESAGLTQQFGTSVMKVGKLAIAPSVIRHPSAAKLVDAVARDPFSIGITRVSESGSAKQLALAGACGMAFHATRQSLKSEDYPLTMPLFIYTPARRLPKIAREFLTYLRSPVAQRAVRAVGFVDQEVSEASIDRQGLRFANAIASAGEETPLEELQRMVLVLRPYTRLSITFRFEAGSTTLDAQSRSNVVLMARLLEAGKYDGREIMFAGFSDGDGDAGANRRIAKRRASAVRAAVIEAATTVKPEKMSLSVEAFGEAMPMACDDTEWGRKVNRRVEVWVK